jgi:hypothetical protein
MQVRYDDARKIYRDCRWCHGKGCLYCESEADKAYNAAFPDGPVPIATFDNTPEGIAAAKAVIGSDAITKAFGLGGGGMAEFLSNLAKASK